MIVSDLEALIVWLILVGPFVVLALLSAVRRER